MDVFFDIFFCEIRVGKYVFRVFFMDLELIVVGNVSFLFCLIRFIIKIDKLSISAWDLLDYMNFFE